MAISREGKIARRLAAIVARFELRCGERPNKRMMCAMTPDKLDELITELRK